MTREGIDPMALRGNLIVENLHTLGEYPGLGVGTIGPQSRIESGEIDEAKMHEMFAEISRGAFNIPVNQDFIKWCVDGRTRKGSVREPDPNAAGGTLSLVYGRVLAPSLSGKEFKTDLELTVDITSKLKEQDLPMGVHGGENSDCDCGACAKAQSIFGLINTSGDSIRQISADHGVTVDDETHRYFKRNAANALAKPGFFIESRPEIIEAVKDNGGEYEHYVRVHNELAAVVNTIPHTTVDRAAIREKYGQNYDVFVVDAWAFEGSAAALNQTGYDEETATIAAGMTYYNFATAAQLGDKSLPILPIAA